MVVVGVMLLVWCCCWFVVGGLCRFRLSRRYLQTISALSLDTDLLHLLFCWVLVCCFLFVAVGSVLDCCCWFAVVLLLLVPLLVFVRHFPCFGVFGVSCAISGHRFAASAGLLGAGLLLSVCCCRVGVGLLLLVCCCFVAVGAFARLCSPLSLFWRVWGISVLLGVAEVASFGNQG